MIMVDKGSIRKGHQQLENKLKAVNLSLNSHDAIASDIENIKLIHEAFSCELINEGAKAEINGIYAGDSLAKAGELVAESNVVRSFNESNVRQVDSANLIGTVAQLAEHSTNYLAEAHTMGEFSPFQSVQGGLLVYGAIATTARHAMPIEAVASERTIVNRKVYEIEFQDGTKFVLPDAWKNPECMRKILGTSEKKIEVTLDLTADYAKNGVIDLKALADGVAKVDGKNYSFSAGEDLLPLAEVKGATDTLDAVLSVPFDANAFTSQANTANHYRFTASAYTEESLGKLKDAPATPADASINGAVNFADKTITISASAGVKTVTLGFVERNQFLNRSITTKPRLVPATYQIDQDITYTMNYDDRSNTYLKSLVNLDYVTESIAQIADFKDHSQDAYVWMELDKAVDVSKTTQASLGEGVNQDFATATFDGADMPAGYAKTKTDFRHVTIPEKMRQICNKFAQSLNSSAGFVTVFYGHPDVTTAIPELNVVYQKNEKFAGVTLTADVKEMKINNHAVRVITTERGTHTTNDRVVDGKKVTDGILKCYPLSYDKSQENLKFLQYLSMLDKENKYRQGGKAYKLPGITYFDLFGMAKLQYTFGELILKDFLG
jgi:hypothetical protein